MKKTIAILFLYGSLFCTAQKVFVLRNKLPIEREDEAIVLKRSQVESLTKFKIPGGKFPLLSNSKGEPIKSQVDDLDKDGIWDELLVLHSFRPKEKVTIRTTYVDAKQLPEINPRAHAQLSKLTPQKTFRPVTKELMPAGHKPTDFSTTTMPLYQTEGPHWENDRIGFRIYLDPRNAKDIFAKTTTKITLDAVGLPGNNYHQKDWWGMDVLKVGNSLGAGSLAFQVVDASGKKLSRLGDDVRLTSYELIADGPLRAIIRLTYTGCKLPGGKEIDVTDEISITAGQYCYESKVTVSHNVTMVTGIVNLLSSKAIQKKAAGYHILATHDKQSENQDHLGMAILVKDDFFDGFGEAPKTGNDKIQSTYYITSNLKANKFFLYRFYGGWEASDSRFKDENFFIDFLKGEAKKLSRPIRISRN